MDHKQLEAAMLYASMGWKIFPCNPLTKEPMTEHGHLDAVDSEEKITEWWTKNPKAAIAMAVPDNIAVVDIDGLDAAPLLNSIPETVSSRTPRTDGGIHLFFEKDPNISFRRRIRFLHGVDMLASGGYVILPYSSHPNGGTYKWIKNPITNRMASLPQWIIDLAMKEEEGGLDYIGDGVLSGKLDPHRVLEGVPEGMRNNALFRFACWMRSHSIPYRLAVLGVNEAAERCDPPYTEHGGEWFVDRAYKRYPEGYSEKYEVSERRIWTAKDLMRASLNEPAWYVDKILPQGFCLFFAHPKAGKSIIAEGMARCLAAGEPIFHNLEVQKCEVLYMELELGENRGRERWSKIFGAKGAPDGLHIAFTWDRMDQGGLDQLRNFLESNPGVKVVFVDVLNQIWPTKDFVQGTAYNKDYAVGEKIARIANEYQVAIVCIHHKTKTDHGDSLKNISSSMGLPAVADTMWDMTRDRMTGIAQLEITGKMVESQVIELLPQHNGIFDWSMG